MRPGAGAAAPSRPPSVSQRPPVPGPRPMPRAHGGQEQGCTAQLGASAQCQQDWLPAVSTPHLLLNRRCGPHCGALVQGGSSRLSQERQADSGALLHFSHESIVPQPAAGRARVLLSSRRTLAADSAFQVTGNNPAIVQCTHGHWQPLKRKITWLPSPKPAFEWRYTSPCPQGCGQRSGRAGRARPQSPR